MELIHANHIKCINCSNERSAKPTTGRDLGDKQGVNNDRKEAENNSSPFLASVSDVEKTQDCGSGVQQDEKKEESNRCDTPLPQESIQSLCLDIKTSNCIHRNQLVVNAFFWH